jgi:hypothetical protein
LNHLRKVCYVFISCSAMISLGMAEVIDDWIQESFMVIKV